MIIIIDHYFYFNLLSSSDIVINCNSAAALSLCRVVVTAVTAVTHAFANWG